MPAPPAPKVTTSNQLWSVSVQLADQIDAINDGQQGIAAILGRQPYPLAYEFSNGRRFKDGPKPDGDG